jgi:hypothetical protein
MSLDHEEALHRALGHHDGAIGHRVVVLDTVGHVEGLALSELLATQGHDVTLAMPMATPMLLDPESMPQAMSRARRAGVDFRPFTLVPMVSSTDGVLLVDALARQPVTLTDVDTVVIRSHGISDPAFADALRATGTETHVVGDAVAARLVDRAVMDGRRAGLAV